MASGFENVNHCTAVCQSNWAAAIGSIDDIHLSSCKWGTLEWDDTFLFHGPSSECLMDVNRRQRSVGAARAINIGEIFIFSHLVPN